MIASCKNKACKSEFQDKEYGKGMRVHNQCTKKPTANNPGIRCTCCGTISVK